LEVVWGMAGVGIEIKGLAGLQLVMATGVDSGAEEEWRRREEDD
jgi:hypothetical protein